MAAAHGRVEEEIRNILASGDEATRGWSDEQIVAEAYRRAGADAPGGATNQSGDMVARIRSSMDNDGQTRA